MIHESPAAGAPALSVVIASTGGFSGIRRVVRHLGRQTVRSRIELVIVAPSEAALADAGPSEIDGFHGVAVVPAGPIDNVDKAAARGVREASAPVVALIEDHAYPEPGWAAALIEAHRGPHAGVGPAVLNANPSSGLSWCNMLIAYGRWGEDSPAGDIDDIPRHNSSFKRAALLAYGDDLERLLGREGGLLQDLRGSGQAFLFHPDARIAHVNPSRLASTADLRFNAGRLYGATRARRNGWSGGKRLLYALAGPLIPLVRFGRLRSELARARRRVPSGVYPALFLGLIFDGAGQMAGYLLGPGGSPDKLAVFEMDRVHHLTPGDRRALDPDGPAG